MQMARQGTRYSHTEQDLLIEWENRKFLENQKVSGVVCVGGGGAWEGGQPFRWNERAASTKRLKSIQFDRGQKTNTQLEKVKKFNSTFNHP